MLGKYLLELFVTLHIHITCCEDEFLIRLSMWQKVLFCTNSAAGGYVENWKLLEDYL